MDENTIVEINSGEISNAAENITLNEDELIVKKKRKKHKKEFFWNKMSKKSKIITIICIILAILLVVGLCIYFFVIKEDEKKPETVVENVVLEKENYIYKNGVLTFLDEDSKSIGTYECKNKDVEECYIAKLTNEDNFNSPLYVDKKGHPIEKNSKIYNENFVFVYDDNQINLYNIKDKKIEKELLLIKNGNIEEDFIVAKDKDEKYGIISFEDDMETIIDFDYEYLGIIDDNKIFVAKENDKSFLIDLDEKRITNFFNKDIKCFDSNYVALADGTEYYLYDYAGNRALEGSYNYIDFKASYVFVIDEGKMFVYSSELTKLNNGFRIKSNTYQKKFIFDEDNLLVDTKKAYTITINADGTISIEDSSSKSVKTINVYESILSEEYDYVSYLDGTLYFYKDLDKTELLGSYKCNNQNKINASSKNFGNCFVAKDGNIMYEGEGYIPIFNENYVFIKDSKDDSSIIILYDLKSNTQKARYKVVDSGLGNNSITFINSINNLIYAQNTEDNYGVITFKEGTPVGVISFKEDGNGTKNLSLLNDNIIATRGNVNYLYTKTGDLLATSKFKMIDFQNEYLVVKDKGYLVYNMSTPSSGTIVSNELDYVKLYDDFFVGIKNKKLNIYLYENGKQGKLEKDLEVSIAELEKSYKITEYSDSYVISIMQTSDASVDYKYDKNWSAINENEQ
ncbi:MAG: hypothetical protein IKR74_02160 [Bacilli bacterium]|nr:hypothetical protein [Bacilli bacterium]